MHPAAGVLAGFPPPQVFVDGLIRTTLIRLAQMGLPASARSVLGGLAPWQFRRAEVLLLDEVRAERSLAEVAESCGLSAGHFARAFRATTGLPPHRWLVRRRVERAQELLEVSNLSLSEIALTCGFFDQSHLTRVFRSVAGASPGAWRRQRRA